MLRRVVSSKDLERVGRVLDKLALDGLRGFAVTGSLALEIQLSALKHSRGARALNDLDLVVESFDSIPGTVAGNFLPRHIHPRAPEGKMLLQLIDPDEALRIDVFRARGATMARSRPVRWKAKAVQAVSLEDLAARIASMLMGLERGQAVPVKYVEDFRHLSDAIDPDQVEIAWRDQRNEGDPPTFREAFPRVRTLMETHGDLLVVPEYSHDVNVVCARCEETGPFRLASAVTVLSILGYC